MMRLVLGVLLLFSAQSMALRMRVLQPDASTPGADNSLLQKTETTAQTGLSAEAKAKMERGFGAAMREIFSQPKSRRSMFTGAAQSVSPVDLRCVLCQYFTQRLQGDIMTYSAPAVYAEMETTITPSKTSHAKAPPAAPDASRTSTIPELSFLELGTRVHTKQQQTHTQTAQAQTGATAPDVSLQGIYATAAAPVGVSSVQGLLPGRYRQSDMLGARPLTARWDATKQAGPTLEQQQARYQYKQMYQVVYQNLEHLCVSRIPQPFIPICHQVMADYPQFAEGLHYNDRPDQICMNLNYCGKLSYAYNAPHARYVEEKRQPADVESLQRVYT